MLSVSLLHNVHTIIYFLTHHIYTEHLILIGRGYFELLGTFIAARKDQM